MNEPWSLGLVVMRTAQAAVAIMVLGVLGAHFEVALPFWGALAFVIGGALGLLNAIAGLLLFARGERRRGLAAMLLSEAAGLTLVWSTMGSLGKPPINDVTTDLDQPPLFANAQNEHGNVGRDLVYPESFKDVVRKSYPDVRGLHLDERPDAAFARAIARAQATAGWRVTYVNGTTRCFEGVDTSPIFRFRDDFVVRVHEDGSGSIVDMRSKSRDLDGDFGSNAERIVAFLRTLEPARNAPPPPAK